MNERFNVDGGYIGKHSFSGMYSRFKVLFSYLLLDMAKAQNGQLLFHSCL